MTAVVVSTAGAMEMGRSVAGLLVAPVHARNDGDVGFETLADHLRGLFSTGEAIVFVGPVGALVRMLAPVLADKTSEPPVVAVAIDGSAVVPVLGGHRGANDLARRIAENFGIAPAITTAGDLVFGLAPGLALDAPPAGWHLATPERYKDIAARLIAGAPARLDGPANWIAASDIALSDDAEITLQVTERAGPYDPDRLVYVAETLALGVGSERGADPTEMIRLVTETLRQHGLDPRAVAGVFPLDLKADEPAMHALADALGRPARFFDAATLEAEASRLATPSETVFREVGCHGVSEGAALAAAGPEARLLVVKHKSERCTCAIAIAPRPIEAAAIGRPRGRLSLVGIGPGKSEWRTPEAERLIGRAEDLVGYSLYLDILGPLTDGKMRHDYPLGDETERARAALDLAAEGRNVALISSGDIGIYAMASLVFELVAKEDRGDWGRLEIEVAPGISALQAAAARIGAPLGHDFCAISLSDLLTPWEVIERRLQAAAEGDFVVAFYNPVSLRRRHQLPRAREILLEHRPPKTPVILARSLGRPEETVRVTTLETLSVDDVDMLTLVMVGSSTTHYDGRFVHTPRGYLAAGKRDIGPERRQA